MKHVKCGDVPSVRAPAQYFVGPVWQNPIATPDDPARANSALVTFEPGARTNWHHHPLGQTLYVTQGAGWFQTKGEPRVDIRAGDSIFIPPGEVHWHGATATSTMSHVAIHERQDGSHITWLEAVSDDEYLGG